MKDYHVIKDKGVKIQMSYHWCGMDADGVCCACLAGCVMLNSLQHNPLHPLGTLYNEYGGPLSSKLFALDELRKGEIGSAANELCTYLDDDDEYAQRLHEQCELETYVEVTPYGVDPSQWEKDMQNMIEHLKELEL